MNEWLDDFKTAVAFLTRLPMPHPQGSMPPNFVRAHRMFPVVGALIGAAIGLFCLLLRAAGLPDLAAAALALGAGAILTGSLHEDGLADVADGFGGGRDTAVERLYHYSASTMRPLLYPLRIIPESLGCDLGHTRFDIFSRLCRVGF